MNAATLSFSTDELAILKHVTRHAASRPLAGLARLEHALTMIKPGKPFHFSAREIEAADEAFQLAPDLGIVPDTIKVGSSDAFHRVKATIAAARVD